MKVSNTEILLVIAINKSKMQLLIEDKILQYQPMSTVMC